MRGERLVTAKKKVEQFFRKGARPWAIGDPRVMGILRKSRQVCQRPCCSNPRHHKIKTHKDKFDIEQMELESMELEDYLEGLRIGEQDFYGD